MNILKDKKGQIHRFSFGCTTTVSKVVLFSTEVMKKVLQAKGLIKKVKGENGCKLSSTSNYLPDVHWSRCQQPRLLWWEGLCLLRFCSIWPEYFFYGHILPAIVQDDHIIFAPAFHYPDN